MKNDSFLGSADPPVIEKMYRDYMNDPESVAEGWRRFFEGFEFARTGYRTSTCDETEKEFRVIRLIDAYRQRGHLFTETNPVRTRRQYSPTLDIENFGLEEQDLETVFNAGSYCGIGPSKLKDIIAHMKQTYCRSVGVEYLYIRTPETVEWLREKMEGLQNTPSFSPDEKKHIYHYLKIASGFENFLHRKFTGQKRFSLEGGESLIPALNGVIERGAELGTEEFVIGMSHRGRLNVLANIMQKPYDDIFDEFDGEEYNDEIALGDVKYHLGYNSTISTAAGKKVNLNLAPNPSHLEAVDPLVLGITRAKLDDRYKGDRSKIAPILIHGDAAIAGQGIVYEIVQMSKLEGYGTGGTIHLVVNNQVGFTTNYTEGRSSTYCTDVAKVIRAPVFHVNVDDVEALVYTIKLAMEYRQKFGSDVFIDILGFRRYGHNEGDEPRFTQPLLYKQIASHPGVRKIYSKRLAEEGVISEEEVKKAEKDYEKHLDEKLALAARDKVVRIKPFCGEEWEGFRYAGNSDFRSSPDTGVSMEKLKKLSEKINTLPSGKVFFKKIEKLLQDRKKMSSKNSLDWAMCELLAYGSLLTEGHPVRLSGQDSIRGTFSHRHASYVVEDSDEKYYPLSNLSEGQARCSIYNSPLSEFGVMGYEYGYALAFPKGLTIWEAQFGDFHNAAQVVIDQFISSAEEKWGLMNGLVLFLPHGYEGQGPEHSSGRIERFLTMCASNNMQVVNPTTPANFFHLLRRQVLQPFRVPLVVFTPKSLLRHPECRSSYEDLEEGGFKEVIDDQAAEPEKIFQVIFTSGRLYYDLAKRKEERKAHDTAIVRIEQLYPFPDKQLSEIINKYPNAERHVWAQDEPENMGAWDFLRRNFTDVNLLPITRPASGAPAGGLMKLHKARLEKILTKSFMECDCEKSRKYCGQDCQKFSMKSMVTSNK